MEEIDPRHLLIKIVEILDKLAIPYLITGGMAVLVWGRPRFTADIDIVVELKKENLSRLERALKDLGQKSFVDPTAMKEALNRDGEFNFIDGITGVKVDFWMLKNNAFDKSRLERRVPREILGKNIYFTSPEDLILIKLQWYKEAESSRQLEDVESIIKISERELDMSYLNDWASRLGVLDTLERLIKR